MAILWGLGGFLIGAVAAAAAGLFLRAKAGRALASAEARATSLGEQLAQQQAELEQLRAQLDAVDENREAAERRVATLEAQLESRDERLKHEAQLREQLEVRFKETFDAIGAKVLEQNREKFLVDAKRAFEELLNRGKEEDAKTKEAIETLLKPVRESLEKHQQAVETIEKKRLAEKATLEEQIKQIADSHQRLSDETSRLVKALRRPEQRGRWGELQLRNTVELAGMTERCDFQEQVTVYRGEDAFRPDMVVNLPGKGVIPVDAKVAIDAYLDALECEDGESRAGCLKRHAEQVEAHWKKLSQKQYWEAFDRAPKIVVLFMPLESALVAALEHKPDLHASAMKNHVLIATPTLLVALLRAVAYGWQQESLAKNARDIAAAGKDLYDRLDTFVGHFRKIGVNLDRSTRAFNAAVGSMERNLLPGARRLKELHATNEAEIESPDTIDLDSREFMADELLAGTDASDGGTSGSGYVSLDGEASRADRRRALSDGGRGSEG